ncbi:ATP-dependent DNA helicase MPH1 [Podospora aff. communis PSN243]|uniref:ATP-dependent DNA helicase n=1 Tax=Podospora aff. communis PSN243 TaxID=3040156 RepID=A0AAV9GXB5_9PEZI|nr:ATP-dependent DNA helicase MPH1 [Podospora aff. communis PSN243]
MDDDEFDDIPDEDLMLALDQASSGISNRLQNGQNGSQFKTASANPAIARPAPRSSTRTSASQSFRQTTLFGATLNHGDVSQSQSRGPGRPFRADLPPETPTHHELVPGELGKWIYPTNLGAIRDYQFSIVKSGLFNNTLVALPTGLGKTFIAATIILNFLRWTKKAKVVFVAPTKPLASQQVQACLSVAGIPRSQATLLTGETPPVLREGEWESRRLFFMTPQTLMNDLAKGYADPKSIVLLVIDEAHRATGDYAYVKVVEFMRRFSKSFRVLALTATPGSTVEAVQDVINNLGISHVEIRREESIDIRQYVHARNQDTITFDPSDEMEQIKEMFSKALKPLVDKLRAQNIYFGRDPMSLTTYGLMKLRADWMKGPGRNANQGLKFMMLAVFGILMSLVHSIKLLNFHGIRPFYHSIAEFRSNEESKGGQGSKYRKQLLSDENFQKMMTTIEAWMRIDGFYGHPKLPYLCETLVNHFVDAGENSGTRAIVFSEYRDSAEEIVRLLNKQPLVSATVFVGQADSKRSEGMKQKQQIETIEKFKNGVYNVLVATSIGEEGLDIGQVDLIVCYDASASPIRMLQRMGRTGRKRAGNIILLLMKGKEEDKFNDAKRNYEEMQALICEGSRFGFRHDLSSRIIPRDIRPEVDKCHVEIPIENTQDPSLPEPKKTAAGLKKKPAKKKFNMPDDVETGFVKASAIGQPKKQAAVAKLTPKPKAIPKASTVFGDFAPIPDLEKVLLSQPQTNELNRLYRDVPLRRLGNGVEEISAPNLSSCPSAQRKSRKTVLLKHGNYTKRNVRMLRALGSMQDEFERDTKPYGEVDTSAWETLSVSPFAEDTDGDAVAQEGSAHKRQQASGFPDEDVPKPKKRQATAKRGGKAAGPRSRGGKGRNLNTARTFFAGGLDVTDEEDEEKNAEEESDEGHALNGFSGVEQSPSPPPGRGRGGKVRGRKRQSGKGLRRVGDNLEDAGDACDRTSDMEVETDGSDNGSDLEGFVVDDNQITSSMLRLSTSPVTPRPGKGGKAQQRLSPLREEAFYTPAPFTQTDGASDDELPDIMSTSAEKENRSVLRKGAGDDESEDPETIRPSPAKGRRRHILIDSDDED